MPDNNWYILLVGLYSARKKLIGYILLALITFLMLSFFAYSLWSAKLASIEQEINSALEENFSQLYTFSGNTSVSSDEKEIVVDVAGAVRRPGVYRLPEGSVIVDAIEKAGGLSDEADRVRISREINQASLIGDHAKIYLFALYDRDVIARSDLLEVGSSGSNNQNTGSNKVNINTAGISELDVLSGIGPATAQKIIEFRESKGGFSSVDQLKEVKGIGDALFEKIKNDVII